MIINIFTSISKKGATIIKKDLIVICIVSLVVITFAFIGCSKQVAGTYVSEKNDKNFIELKEDGSFFFKDGEIHGEYTVKGNRTKLVWGGGRFSSVKIKGIILEDSNGDKWVKK